MNMADVEGICQALEGVLAAWRRHEVGPRPEVLTVDSLTAELDAAADIVGRWIATVTSPETIAACTMATGPAQAINVSGKLAPSSTMPVFSQNS